MKNRDFKLQISNYKFQIGNFKSIKPRPAVAPGIKPRPAVALRLNPRPSAALHINSRLSVALMAVLFLLAAGCGEKIKEAQQPAAEKIPARSVVERGPVKVTAEVQPAKARLSDEPVLSLTIEYEQGVKVEKPPFGASMGGFLIRDFHEPLPKIHNGREIIQQIYTLEPMQTGKLLIDPIGVTFTDLRPKGDEKTHTLQTEALSMEISSMVDNAAPSLGNLRPAADPVALPSSVSVYVWLIIIFCLLSIIAGWWLWLRKKKAKAEAIVIVSPEELARAELEKLAQSRLSETDLVQFYVELTAIVRRYIERTTGIRAPEQTTEEFLREISRANTFKRNMNERLRNFLESADLVKFAAYRPRPEDVDESLSRAKIFIGLKPQDPERLTEEAVA
jgi:hypothetical protein